MQMFFWHLLGNGARALKPYDYGRIFGKMILTLTENQRKLEVGLIKQSRPKS